MALWAEEPWKIVVYEKNWISLKELVKTCKKSSNIALRDNLKQMSKKESVRNANQLKNKNIGKTIDPERKKFDIFIVEQ